MHESFLTEPSSIDKQYPRKSAPVYGNTPVVPRRRRSNIHSTSANGTPRSSSGSRVSVYCLIYQGDRYIAHRGEKEFNHAELLLDHDVNITNQRKILAAESPTKRKLETITTKLNYSTMLMDALLCDLKPAGNLYENLSVQKPDGDNFYHSISAPNSKFPIPTSTLNDQQKILNFKGGHNRQFAGFQASYSCVYEIVKDITNQTGKIFRPLPRKPEKILDAPEIKDDFYLNLLDWSSTNLLAIALDNFVYLWDAKKNEIFQMANVEEPSYISSLQWQAGSSFLGVGTSDGSLIFSDIEVDEVVSFMHFPNDKQRIATIAWNGNIVTSGDKSGKLKNTDLRMKTPYMADIERAHDQEICQLKWSSDGIFLASGGNDNRLKIWDIRDFTKPVIDYKREFTATVKGIDWCPWQRHLLAAGGGTNDPKIRLIHTDTGNIAQKFDTKAQITSLLWSKHDKELLSGHGFSRNSICLWKYSNFGCKKLGELKAHKERVLALALSPDGTVVASAGADENLMLWKMFDAVNTNKNKKQGKECFDISSLELR